MRAFAIAVVFMFSIDVVARLNTQRLAQLSALDTAPTSKKSSPTAPPANQKLNQLSLEQKVGQMFLFGFKGHKLTPELQTTIKTLHPGGFLIFGRNIKSLSQVYALNQSLQNASIGIRNPSLFLAVDQEGGSVARIHTTPPLPSAYTIGGAKNPELAFKAGKVTGEMLSVLGFNMNLAPVLDKTDDNLMSFISSRGFSSSPQLISQMGTSFARGLAESNIIPVAKHFPGHGPIQLDTHHITPSRQLSLTELMSSELLPFKEFANQEIPSGVMVAHIVYPAIDPQRTPATYSKKIISEVLIEKLNFNGLIMTDDIEMGGAATLEKIEDRAVAAVEAGNDLIMVGWTPSMQTRAVRGVIDAVRKGRIPVSRIDASVKKILDIKTKILSRSFPRNIASNKISPIAQFRSIQYGPVFDEIFANYFKNSLSQTALGGVKEIAVVSELASFTNSFQQAARSLKNISVRGFRQLPSVEKSGGTLIVYHVSSAESLARLRRMDPQLAKFSFVINSNSKLKLQDASQFFSVVQTFSYSPTLGALAAQQIANSLIKNSTDSVDHAASQKWLNDLFAFSPDF